MGRLKFTKTKDCGDATSRYDVTFDKPLTVQELLKNELNSEEFGRISAKTDTEKVFDVKYDRNSKLCGDVPDNVLDCTIESISCNGGWGNMDYCLVLHATEMCVKKKKLEFIKTKGCSNTASWFDVTFDKPLTIRELLENGLNPNHYGSICAQTDTGKVLDIKYKYNRELCDDVSDYILEYEIESITCYCDWGDVGCSILCNYSIILQQPKTTIPNSDELEKRIKSSIPSLYLSEYEDTPMLAVLKFSKEHPRLFAELQGLIDR